MSNLPIACSLTASDLASAKAHYRTAASQYQATVQIRDGQADISLTGDKTTLHDLLTEMIERENACCPFLSFAVIESTTGYDVRLTVLDDSGLEDSILREMVDTLFPGALQLPTFSR
jgi:hypothetical protein